MSCRVTEEANVSCGVEIVICACVCAVTAISHGYGDSAPHTFVGDASWVIEAMGEPLPGRQPIRVSVVRSCNCSHELQPRWSSCVRHGLKRKHTKQAKCMDTQYTCRSHLERKYRPKQPASKSMSARIGQCCLCATTAGARHKLRASRHCQTFTMHIYTCCDLSPLLALKA